MVKFENKSTEITMAMDAEGKDLRILDYADLVVMLLNNPPKQGWTTSEMRLRIKIEDKLENTETDSTVEFEEKEVQKIIECLNMPWSFKHKAIIEFEDYLLSFK